MRAARDAESLCFHILQTCPQQIDNIRLIKLMRGTARPAASTHLLRKGGLGMETVIVGVAVAAVVVVIGVIVFIKKRK